MPISVDIHPIFPTLPMYGEPDASTAYSLSGHVTVSLTSNPSYFGEKPRPTKVLLRSLILTLEGQSELVTHETGYSATRLVRLTRELVPAQTMLLSNEGLERDGAPGSALEGAWNFVFNLPVPGWLPASSVFGNDAHGRAGTRYTLFAEARFAGVGIGANVGLSGGGGLADGLGRTWGIAALCASIAQPKVKIVQAPQCEIEVRRCVLPPARMLDGGTTVDGSAAFPDATFLVETRTELLAKADDQPMIPLEVLEKVEVLASVPEHVSVDDNSVPLTLRVRAAELPAGGQKKLRLTEFAINISQIETYHKAIMPGYKINFPVPSSACQPMNLPLSDPHPIKPMFDIGLISATEKRCTTFADHFSLLPPKQSGRYRLTGEGVDLSRASRSSLPNATSVASPSEAISTAAPEADDPSTEVQEEDNLDESTDSPDPYPNPDTFPPHAWCKVEVNVPLRHISPGSDVKWEQSRGRVKALRPSHEGPHIAVRHELSVELTCAYGEGGKDDPREKLHFGIPLSFVCLPPGGDAQGTASSAREMSGAVFSRPSTPGSTSSGRSSSSLSMASQSSDSVALASSLPAYSQLFYPNGDRKIDYSMPLPLYTPPSSDRSVDAAFTDSRTGGDSSLISSSLNVQEKRPQFPQVGATLA